MYHQHFHLERDVNGSLHTVKRALHSVKHALCTVKHALLTIKHALLTVKHALLTVKHALCTLKHALCTVKHACLFQSSSHVPGVYAMQPMANLSWFDSHCSKLAMSIIKKKKPKITECF